MTWNQLLFGLTVTVLLFSEGCHSETFECGFVPPLTKTPGANNFAPGNWPWLVRLNNGRHDFCSGSLIERHWVLTSAYCMSRHGSGSTKVYLGYNQSHPSPDEVSRTVVGMTCHPNYDNYTGENDICLLKLSAPVNFTDTITRICLPRENSMFFTGERSWVSRPSEMEVMEGEEGNNTSKALQEVKLSVVGNNECRCIHGRKVTDNTVCAKPTADDDDESYEGDLGGPLIALGLEIWFQIGIVSFGSGWANASTPRGYTRISEYKEWISGVVGNNSRPVFNTYFNFFGGINSDLNFTCPTHETPTHEPQTGDRNDGSVFDSGESVISFSHFTHLASMCSLALYLWVFG